MGIGGISIWQLLIILAIVILIFGTKKLRNIGGDLGGAVKNFKSAVKDGEAEQGKADADADFAQVGHEDADAAPQQSVSEEKEKAS